jgi:hypothetical protein
VNRTERHQPRQQRDDPTAALDTPRAGDGCERATSRSGSYSCALKQTPYAGRRTAQRRRAGGATL